MTNTSRIGAGLRQLRARSVSRSMLTDVRRPPVLTSTGPSPRYCTSEYQNVSSSTPTRLFSSSIQRSSQNNASLPTIRARRSMLYVPGSSDKMIKKSQKSDADCIIFDLEDSVADHRKGAAREAVLHGLNAAPRPGPELAVRINPPSGNLPLSKDDLDIILPSAQLETIVVPKVEHEDDIKLIFEKCQLLRNDSKLYRTPLNLVLSIESAASLLRMPRIIESILEMTRNSTTGQGDKPSAVLSSLLFASEDYCASTGIIRTRNRREMLFPRSQIVTLAKAYGLTAIDMVCIDYKDVDYMIEESQDGRELGFDGKQAIHPAQVQHIQNAYSPSEKDVERSARIKQAYEASVAQNAGAVGFQDGEHTIMIDAPMLKQAEAVLSKARASGMTIPDFKKVDFK